jgi:ABC-type branched-subunit amino acid transport system substrate-binding protein/DNA-binding beta-propeller fold protein YncE
MKAAVGPGELFAGYRVEWLAGRGGMGVVYRATDLSLERPVALKLIAPELAEDEAFRARFLREPRLAASLDHPNVIPIYEAGEHEGQLYLAMRFVEGSDLKSLLARERSLAPERALAVLAQVADALDAAHRRALVHRDVKPANVLIDKDGHAYLTDFGISKQVGGESTDTGRIVGTLDYLAPEQIRGDPVDARTDTYALACVLYECLSGGPPFRRATEAQTLWAHMQEEPPPLAGQAALDPVLRKALAKDREERHTTCAELIGAAGAALGLAPPRERAVARRVRRRYGRLLLAGGFVLALAVAGAALAALTGGGGPNGVPVGNGVVALGGDDGQFASFTTTDTAPSNVAVGEGAVWVLNTEEDTVARIAPEAKRVVRRFRTPGRPTDIAAGLGAVWVGTGERLSRIDPRTGQISRTVKLPSTGYRGDLGFLDWGFPQIAVGAGAVWAVNPDRTVSRIDPETGRREATIDVDAATIAAGKEGVWYIDADDTAAVTPIDLRTNRAGRPIRVGAQNLSAVAVGGGYVWASAEGDGLVWRIEPGRSPITRTIDVGVGVTFLAYHPGAIWAANDSHGTVARIDVRTSDVQATPVGAVQGLAAGQGSAWVSTAGATFADGLPQTCGELLSGAARPDVLITSDFLLQGPYGDAPREMADAIEFVLRQHDFKAGGYSLGYRACDDSNAQTGNFDRRTCAANANAYARASKLVAVIGTYNSACAQVEIPILNRAPNGPVAMISPSNTYVGLTRPGLPPPLGYRGEPDVYYPTGTRNYVRVLPPDDMHGAAHALLAKDLGLRSVYLLHDDSDSDHWKGQLIDPFRYAAQRLDVPIAGSAAFDPDAQRFDELAERVARSGADGIVLAADPFFGGDRVLKALRTRLGTRATIMAGYFFSFAPEVLKRTGAAAHGVYVATSDVPRAELDLGRAAERFAQDFGEGDNGYVLEAAQTAELVIRAIARSDGTRASVLEELKATRVKDGLLGSFRFDRNGDVTPATVPILRVTGATPPQAGLPSNLQGAVVDRVVEIPRRLIR